MELKAHKRNPELSIIIVNSDGIENTLSCLDSIFLHPPLVDFEVILVDNCSDRPCIPLVLANYPEVIVSTAPQRQGFARNYNLGIQQARGEYILILNNDTLAHPGTFTRLVEEIRTHPEYGMVGPQLLSADGRIQTVCVRSLPTVGYYVGWQLFLDPGILTGKVWDAVKQWQLSRLPSCPVECISGACMLVSRRAMDDVGMLDEGYQFYYEDIEWCHRMQKHGYRVGYTAEAKLTHLGDQSLSKIKEIAKQSEYRSAIRYFNQYYNISTAQIFVIWLATLFGYAMRAFAFSLYEFFSRKQSHAHAYHNLTRWIYSNRPRRSVQIEVNTI